MNKLTTCKACGKEVSKGAKKCITDEAIFICHRINYDDCFSNPCKIRREA